MKATYKLIFGKNGISPDGTGRIHLRIYLNRGEVKYHATKLKIHKSQWDEKHNCILVTDKTSAQYDETLKKLISELESYELDLIKRGEWLTVEKVDEYFKHTGAGDFLGFIRQELANNRSLKPGTTKGHYVMLGKLEALQSRIPFNEVNYDLVSRFDNYLRTLDIAVNTVADHHKVLRRYINQAIKKNLIPINQQPYRYKFRIIREAVSRSFLSDEEVVSIEGLDLSTSLKLSQVRDMFLFCCYTGLRFSDMQNLSMNHIQVNSEGMEIMLHKMIKVPQPVFIPMHLLFDGKAETIIKRYDLPFPTISNQKANDYLRDIVHFAGITKHVTWHSSRHYFCSYLAGRYNDPYLIMSLAGHSELKTSMLYIHTSQELLKNKLRFRTGGE